MQTLRGWQRTGLHALLSVVLLAFQTGCPSSPTAGGGSGSVVESNGSAGDDVITEGRVVSLATDLEVSGNQDVTIRYAVPTNASNVRAFYVRESDRDNSAAITYFDFGTPLQTGNSQFTINSDMLPRGRFFIGLSYIDSAGTAVFAYSSGRLIIEGLPIPEFILPDRSLEFVVGQETEANVNILVDLGDPEGEVAWRLFFASHATAPDLASVDPGQIAGVGTELAVGSGNVAEFVWNVGSVAPGTYRVGISATDSGFSVAETAAAGDGERIQSAYNEFQITLLDEEAVKPEPPVVAVTSPNAPVATFLTQEVTIEFTVEFFEGDQQVVNVFYDDDFSVANGTLGEVASGLDGTDTSAVLSTANLDEGTYSVGVTADDGKNDPVTTYATGTISVAKTPTLTVTAPSSSGILTRPSGQATIAWTTNVPATAAQTEVVVFPDTNGDNVADDGAEAIEVRELSDDPATTAVWQPVGRVGRFVARVRIVFNDDSVPDLSAQAPGAIRVSTAPRIVWVGEFDDAETEDPKGAIFGGVQFEDNLGSSFTPVGDLDGDGNDEVVMVSRYGKPFFSNPDGVGHGEAYLVYGSSSRLAGVYNMNSLGTSMLRGVILTGIRTPQGSSETDGLSDVSRIPDVDGDGLEEIVFGFPNVESRGHNADPDQDGIREPQTLNTLEKDRQFLRGGIVIVSSTNSILRNPAVGSPVINLDLVGQNFDITCVRFEPGDEEDMVLDSFNIDSDPPCDGTCGDPMSDGNPDTTLLNWGFVQALSDDYFVSASECLTFYNYHLNGCFAFYPDGEIRQLFDYCTDSGPGCSPTSPALHRISFFDTALFNRGFSGYYPDTWDTNADEDPGQVGENDVVSNEAREPFGARIIGVGLEDGFGSSITLSNPLDSGAGDVIVSAMNRTARGILFQEGEFWDPTWPETGGEIDGLERPAGQAATNAESGVAYMFDLRSLWTADQFGQIPPKPHQYIVGEASHCGQAPGMPGRIDNIDAIRIAGAANENISNLLGIKDFNGDGRNDIAVAAPNSNRLYIAFRREEMVEGDYVLEKLELAVGDPQRLSGALVTGTPGSRFAFSMATDVDLNGDGDSDLIVGAPDAGGSVGEVYVIFASPDLITPQNGTNIETLVTDGRAAKIVGRDPGDFFGFNVANGGDIDGDGTNDLLVSAPGGTPRFDSNPFDEDDTLDELGLDIDGNGQKDDVTSSVPGSWGRPDGEVTDRDNLEDAGLVFVLWGSNVINGTVQISELGGSGIEGAIVVGRRGADPGAARTGDFLGGGDAGDTTFGGITAKRDRGRSFGLRAAGDLDGDGKGDFVVGSIIATPRIDPNTGEGTTRGGEAYIVYGFDR